MSQATHYFPKDFKWGTATSSHQVEGNNTNNQWHVWEQQPGNIQNGDVSGRACDWWNNAEADFDLMVELGQNAHRLSLEWSRIEPREGVFDDAALARYRAMLVGLRRRGIEPMVTLHHFTNPIWLEEQGGWEKHEVVVPRFERFVTKVVRALGDVCDLWCTINEPNVYALMGYLSRGRMPPGKNDLRLTLEVSRNMVLGHAVAYHALHAHQPTARVGIAHHARHIEPASPRSPFDAMAARFADGLWNWSVLNSIQNGRWDPLIAAGAPSSRALKGTLDWIGVNYYCRQLVRFRLASAPLFVDVMEAPNGIMSDHNFGEVYPDGLTPLLRRIAKYRLPIYITENGLPDATDALRPSFLITHLRKVWAAANMNWNVLGYYHWSLVDNFEWGEGYRMKFGLVGVDVATQQRAPRPSAWLYRDIARANALSSDHVAEYAPELLPTLFP